MPRVQQPLDCFSLTIATQLMSVGLACISILKLSCCQLVDAVLALGIKTVGELADVSGDALVAHGVKLFQARVVVQEASGVIGK